MYCHMKPAVTGRKSGPVAVLFSEPKKMDLTFIDAAFASLNRADFEQHRRNSRRFTRGMGQVLKSATLVAKRADLFVERLRT